MLGLDYSAGRPSAQAVLDAGYGFVVRYVGTPGRTKNLTAAEAADMLTHGVGVALVYEDRAGTALQGRARGRADARSVLDDAAACGVEVRCAYLAVDFDVTSSAQQAAVDDYLAGAADILGAARVGVYGEYSVVEHCLTVGAARYGWQTMAWSGGRISTRAHLLQRLGQVVVGGVTCDVDEARVIDFGQWPAPAGIETTRDEDDDMVIISAPGRPWLAYYPTSGVTKIIGPREQDVLRTVHQAAGEPAKGCTVTADEYDLFHRFALRTAAADVDVER